MKIINIIDYRKMPLDIMPKKFANTAVASYVVAMLTIAVVYSQHMMEWYWWLFGIVSVMGFFYGVNRYTTEWRLLRIKNFEKKLFWMAFSLRVISVFVLYYFFIEMTGRPFEFLAADSYEYGEEGKWMAECIREGNFRTYWGYITREGAGVSDAGYPFYLGIIYTLTDDSIIAVRLLKSFWGALTCVLIYRLTSRNFGESVGRIAGIMLMLEPHFILYCGLHLKEVEMVFLTMLFLEMMDKIFRNRDFGIKAILPAILVLASLFLFRTPLAISLAFAVVVAVLLSSKKVISMGRRWLVLILLILASGVFVGGKIMMELESMWNQRETNQKNRLEKVQRTNELAKYASSTVFAPLIFTIPFPTMVETENQENHRLLHGGVVVKNITSFFCIIALLILIFDSSPISGWRNNVLIGAYLISYLGILAFSAFAQAGRFHLPAIPIELSFAAFGMTKLSSPLVKRWSTIWCVVMLVTWIAWSWFKLKGRGMV